MKARTTLVNQMRGFLLEYGIAIGRGPAVLKRRMLELVEGSEGELTDTGRALLWELYEELVGLEDRIAEYDRRLHAQARSDERCQRLQQVHGIGPLTASALVSSIGDASEFASARHFSAALGLVPRQHSTGGKARLLGISKRGNKYLRTLLVHCARAALRSASGRTDRLSVWALEVQRRRGHNVAVVALANKLARIAWVLLSRAERYAPTAA